MLKKLTRKEKARLLTGCDYWHTRPTQDIRTIFFSDGPAGVRCEDPTRPQDEFNRYESFPATCIPCGAAVGASFHLSLIEEVYAVLGEEAAQFGVDVLLAPAMNLKRTPLGGRNFEYFSEDPYHSGKIAAAAVRGIQSAGVGACVKHFAANNSEFERMKIDVRIGEDVLREMYLRGFEIAVKESDPLCVMGAYNKVNGTYCCENGDLLTEILRGEWGFRGLVVSDWCAVHDRVAALAAGCDLAMPYDETLTESLEKAVERGEIREELLNASIERIRLLAARTAGKKGNADFEKGYRLALMLAEESIVLLKNDGILPLAADKKILIAGVAARRSKYLGGGSAECNAYRISEPFDALSAAMDRKPVYTDGENIHQARVLARECDAAVVFIGSLPGHDTEGRDADAMCVDSRLAELCDVLSEVVPVVVALQTGTPVEMPFLSSASAVLQCHLSGEAGGEAVANVICGKVNPSGRLAETIPVRYEVTPCVGYTADREKMRYAEGMNVGYRHYWKRRQDALFPFGYGLGYSEFAYREIRVLRENERYVAEVILENVSARDGKEVVQIYVFDPAREIRQLKGFEKVALSVGERRRVRVALDDYAFCYFDVRTKRWTERKGKYIVSAAKHALDEGLFCEWEVI